MSRQLNNPLLTDMKKIVQITKGGTGASQVPLAVSNLELITSAVLNTDGSGIALNSSGKIPGSKLANSNTGFNTANLDGNFTPVTNTTYQYEITDYDSFKTYTISCSAGTLVRNANILTYTAPATTGNQIITINGRVFTLNVVLAAPVIPSITSPVNNATVSTTSYTLTSSAFVEYGDTATHASSDWQISTDSGFNTIVKSTTADTVNKTSWTVTGLVDGTTYYARMRHNATNGNSSAWSATDIFNIVVPVPITPSITSPVAATNTFIPASSFTSSAFGALPDGSTQTKADWQLATDAAFSNIVKSTTGDTSNLTSWSPTGLAFNTNYYVRTRQTSSNGKTSAWSPSVYFTTITQVVVNLTIASNQLNYVLNTAKVAGYVANATKVTLTVNSGVYLGSAAYGTYALDVDTSWAPNDSISIVNNGYILGIGGTGGAPGGSAGSGGNALRVQNKFLTITNNGTIAGGGGGGGGGVMNGSGASGGGGAGYSIGAGGTSSDGRPGSNSTVTIGGAGGTGGDGAGGTGGTAGVAGGNAGGNINGGGGGGGGWGASGGSGGGSGNWPAGIGGKAVLGNSYISWAVTGTTYGTISP